MKGMLYQSSKFRLTYRVIIAGAASDRGQINWFRLTFLLARRNHHHAEIQPLKRLKDATRAFLRCKYVTSIVIFLERFFFAIFLLNLKDRKHG